MAFFKFPKVKLNIKLLTLTLFLTLSSTALHTFFVEVNKSASENKSLKGQVLQAVAGPSLDTRHPDAGIWVAYQVSNTVEDLQKPYIKGVMVYSAWKRIYSGKNSFRWDALDKDLDEIINQAGKKTFIVVTAGYCPNLEWPQFMRDTIASHKELNGKDCYPLQFWDPLYIQYYKSYITALANHLAEYDSNDNNPSQTDILFVRAQVMADTMENLPNDYENWRVEDFNPAPNPAPDGHIYNQNLTKNIAYDYQQKIALFYKNELVRAYDAVNLTPPVPVAKGGGYWGPEPNRDLFIQEGIWFDKHSGAPNPRGWYYDMVEKVKLGETRGADESGQSWPCQYLAQFYSWETLMALHSGMEFIGIFGFNGNDDDCPEASKGAFGLIESKPALEFGEKYAGYQRNPSLSPGAWIALRGQYPENRWSGKIHHSRLWSNYEFLIQQYRPQNSVLLYGPGNVSGTGAGKLVPEVKRNTQQPWDDEVAICQNDYSDSECEYLYQKPDVYVGFDGNKHTYTYSLSDLGNVLYCSDQEFCQDPASASRQEEMLWARKTDIQNNHNYMRFNINDQFAQSLSNNTIVKVIYLDQGIGRWQLVYDALSDSEKTAIEIQKTNSNIWKTVEVELSDVRFENNQSGNTDLALFNMNDDDDIFHMVEVMRTSFPPGSPTPIPTPTPSPIPGDLDGDGDVDIFDLILVGSHFGEDVGVPCIYDPCPDADGDGDVDIFDLITVGSHFGEG
jgi:hypothetical protein